MRIAVMLSPLAWAGLTAMALGSCAEQRGEPTPTVVEPPLANATDKDPEALDEGLSDALIEVQNKFRCNRISGCPAHARIVAFGWAARVPVEKLFARASRRARWRARLVLIVAELRDPAALPMLMTVATDRDDEAVAYALYGLGLLDYRAAKDRVAKWASAGRGMQFAMTRLAARWVLARWGDERAGADFRRELSARAGQMLAGTTVAWGLQLCAQDAGASCALQRAQAVKHPGFVARREVVRYLERHGTLKEVHTLVILAADPIASIARRSQAVLVRLTGRSELQGGAAWHRWCESGGCSEEASAGAAERQGETAGAAAAP